MKNTIIIMAVVLVALGLGYAYYSSNTSDVLVITEPISSSTPTTSNTPANTPEKQPITAKTTTGTFICLPHKNTSGPQTMECAFGLKTSDGANFALDLSSVNPQPVDLPVNGEKFSVIGTVVPIEAISSTNWGNYDIQGIIKVEKYSEVVTSSPPVISADGKVTLSLNQPITVGATTLSVRSITEESRCPTDVYCIQAGTVTVELTITNQGGPSTSPTLQIGKVLQTGNLIISLDDVTPHPVSTHNTSDKEYRFSLTIKVK